MTNNLGWREKAKKIIAHWRAIVIIVGAIVGVATLLLNIRKDNREVAANEISLSYIEPLPYYSVTEQDTALELSEENRFDMAVNVRANFAAATPTMINKTEIEILDLQLLEEAVPMIAADNGERYENDEFWGSDVLNIYLINDGLGAIEYFDITLYATIYETYETQVDIVELLSLDENEQHITLGEVSGGDIIRLFSFDLTEPNLKKVVKDYRDEGHYGWISLNYIFEHNGMTKEGFIGSFYYDEYVDKIYFTTHEGGEGYAIQQYCMLDVDTKISTTFEIYQEYVIDGVGTLETMIIPNMPCIVDFVCSYYAGDNVLTSEVIHAKIIVPLYNPDYLYDYENATHFLSDYDIMQYQYNTTNARLNGIGYNSQSFKDSLYVID